MDSEFRHDDIDARMMDVIVQCATVQPTAEFSQVIKGALREVLPHEVMVCGLGGVSSQGQYIHKMLNHDYPIEYFAAMRDADGMMEGRLKKWRESLEPVFFQSGRDDADFPEDWIRIFNHYDLRNTIGHGVMDFGARLLHFLPAFPEKSARGTRS